MAITVEQLLVTLGIDLAAVEVSSTGRYVMIQRDPQPDEAGINIATDVVFTLVDLDGDPSDVALVPPDFTVLIEGDLALTYAAGVPTWQPAWNGTVVTHVVASPYAFWTMTAQQVAPLFESEQVVPVQVDITNPVIVQFFYYFDIEDLTPPILIAAEAIDPFTVRLTFDDTMITAGSGSVVDVVNWIDAIARWNVDPLPGVNLDVVSIGPWNAPTIIFPTAWTYVDATERLAATGFADEDVYGVAYQQSDATYWMLADIAPTWIQVVPASQYDATVNWEMTPGCRYQITAGAAIEDESGNVMNTVFNTVFFDGFVPEVPEGRAFSHWRHMIPQKNRTEDATRDLERTSNCVEEILGWMLYYVDHFTDQFDPDKGEAQHIEAMLYDMGNPFSAWVNLELGEIQKKKLLRILVEIYKSKGTAWGIEQTVFFLLGEVVTCVEYIAGGWVLGVDALGSNSVAEVMNHDWETYDFTTVVGPWQLEFSVEGGVTQTVTFVAGDFVNPALATAAEVAAVISAQLVGGAAYPLFPGQPAQAVGTNAEPFAVSAGDSFDLLINGDPTVHTVTFTAADIAVPAAATAAELTARIGKDLDGLTTAVDDGGAVVIDSVVYGALGMLDVQAGAIQAVIGLPLGLIVGTDHGQVSAYSEKAGVEASIQITGGSANVILGWYVTEIGATGGAVLAPDDSYTLYSFDIETENVLTSLEEDIVRKVAEYMKCAHEHLINIRQALPLPWPDGWVLGIDELDETTELAE